MTPSIAAIFGSGAMSLGIIGSSIVAFASSGWIFRVSLGPGGLPGCSKGSGCDAATRGRWSKWGSVPVAAFGAAVYFLMALAALAELNSTPSWYHQAATSALLILAMMAIGAAIWFIALQVFVIRRLCLYCLIVHACGLVAAALALSHAPWRNSPAFPLELAIAGVGTAILIIGQLLLAPKTYAVIPAPAAMVAAPLSAEVIQPQLKEPARQALPERRVSLFKDRVKVDLSRFPVIGPPDAQYVLAYLFDHTCHECHHLHRLLHQVIDHYAGRLAVVQIPVPLHHSCNPTVNCPKQERIQACAYARLGLAVWMADPTQYAEWDRFMAGEEESQPFGLALAKARELTDVSRFKISESDAVLDERIAAGIEVYRAAGMPMIPSLVLSGGILRGHVPTKEALIEVLDKLLASQTPVEAVKASTMRKVVPS
jgi:uncharacterized membrane protein